MAQTEQITTCQICGRPIKAHSGVIAHHGYKRPGTGWQTASCMGARFLPYEQACDRIAVVIDFIQEYVKRQTSALEKLVAYPPETLTKNSARGYKTITVTVSRPADFSPESSYRSYRPDAYDTLFFTQKWTIEKDIERARNDIVYLTGRLENWVEVR